MSIENESARLDHLFMGTFWDISNVEDIVIFIIICFVLSVILMIYILTGAIFNKNKKQKSMYKPYYDNSSKNQEKLFTKTQKEIIKELPKKKDEEEILKKEKEKIMKTQETTDKSFERDKEINKLKLEISDSLKGRIGLYDDLQKKKELLVKKEKENSALKAENISLKNKNTELEGKFKEESKAKPKIGINHELAQTYTDIGTEYLNITHYHKAVKYFQKAIEAGIVDPLTYFSMGVAYQKLGNEDKANECFQKYELIRKR